MSSSITNLNILLTMADSLRDENKHSPAENFNPLEDDTCTAEYLRQASKDKYEEDESDNSDGNVDDLQPNSDEEDSSGNLLQYGTTPPIPRQHKRDKLKNGGTKTKPLGRSYKTFLNERRQQQPKTVVNVIKREFQGDPALCSLGEFDSDDNLDVHRERQERQRKESKKTLSRIRRSDQAEKRLSEDFSHISVSESLGISHLSGYKLEGSGRFYNRIQQMRAPLHQSLDSRVRRKITEPPQCSSDRLKFHQEFSILIRVGTEAKRNEEKSSYKRQISVEQEQRRNNMIEQIWLELRAYLNNGMSAEEQSECLMRERQISCSVIDEINNFCFANIVAQDCPDSAFVRDPGSANLFFKPSEASYKEQVSRSVSASFSDVNLTDDTACLQEKALIHVQKLLDKLFKCESCYSTTKAFCRANEKYRDPVFQRRVKCLNLWLNITCDLCQKLKLFGRIIGHSHGSNWPLMNFEFPQVQPKEFLASPRPSIPNIVHSDTSDNNDGSDEEEDVSEGKNNVSRLEGDVDERNSPIDGEKQCLTPQHAKQVKFLCGSEDEQAPSAPSVVGPVFPVDASTPVRGGSHTNFSSVGSSSLCVDISRASSELSLDENHPKPSFYRHYAEKCLRKMGLHKLNLRLRKLFHDSLKRAKDALERPKESFYTDSSVGAQPDQDPSGNAEATPTNISDPSEVSPRPSLFRGSSLSEHGEWSQQFIDMGLPSFRPTYLFVVRIHVDVIHECLKIRKEQRPKGDPSFLSIRQLIRECKEVLKGATIVKQYYQFMVNAVIWDEQEAENKVAMDLTDFDEDLKSMLDVYFNYLQSWIYMLQSLPEASLGMKSALEEEWAFTKSICASIINGEAEAGKKFSSLASSLLSSIGDFLDNGIDENTRSLYDGDDEEDEEERDEENGEEDERDCEGDDEGERFGDSGEVNTSGDENENYKAEKKSKQNIQSILKDFKNLFNEARERASKALGFAKLLRNDLEIAADFNISVSTEELLAELARTHHIQVLAPQDSRYMMFIPRHIIDNRVLILQLLNVTSGQEEDIDPSVKEEGYLLMLRCESINDPTATDYPIWSGEVIRVEPTAETAIALSHIEVMGLLFVVAHSSILSQELSKFQKLMGNTVQIVNEQTSCHQSIAESLSELKINALDLMVKVSQSIKQVNERLNGSEIIQQDEHILKLYRETMLKIYDFGFEYQKELMRLISHDQKEKQCKMIVAFAKDWMDFVKNKCETGRGIRPRWATQGLEFVSLACKPENVVYLNDEEFKDFQILIRQCLTHMIGPLHTKHVGHGIYVNRNPDPSRGMGAQPSFHRLTSCPENRFYRSISSRSVESEPAGTGHHSHHSSTSSVVSTPSSPGTAFFAEARANRHSIPELPQISVMDTEDGAIILAVTDTRRSSEALKKPRSERLRDSIQKLERERETMLREKRVIGKLSQHIQEADYRMNIKRVKFRWQRGIKIGGGQFGKVYTAVNINTGELMAMKEMEFQPNDHMFLKQTRDEIKNLEGINHENLVRYYGVEVHKEEMLIFMEYCDSGSIEEVARLGLPEYMIRRYTFEINKAVAHLHENGLIHRDIKGANIFLTSQGHVKLGDFGCSVKLKNQHTMPGENVNLVGTTAYMAPEVITQSDQAGHGRAADIWSLGCVVLEMFTGKRPWHELQHNLQVMFKVGMGDLPTIPDSITKEGKSYILACLVHNPYARSTAQQLLDHIFIKCSVDENDGDDL